ncbi:hypothetical protein IFM89_039590 [Coptis chinensis]|uniref:Uncharacterized protein n=1 Tax=Coptis chinensis TaxID=261450 RepID=A0A835LH64_9MAGN|nr:hypothetical protein IFM89_039590 [Coptis chinensis]
MVVLLALAVCQSHLLFGMTAKLKEAAIVRERKRICASYNPSRGRRRHALSRKPTAKARALSAVSEEEEFQVLTALSTKYNDIVIVDTPKSRILLLDSTHNVHSIYNKGEGVLKWTGSYWDEFASLPAIVPQGPIAILGLGGGTSARLMLDLWPSLKLKSWEIDEILIDKSREYLGLSDLEKCTQDGGFLDVYVGDALSPSASTPGGFAGIVVDLFSDGKILPQLQEVTTWLELSNKLMSHGRIMVNCGGAHAKTVESWDGITHKNSWDQNSTIRALCSVFAGNLCWKKMEGDGENYLALTGPFPDLDVWSALVPEQMSPDFTLLECLQYVKADDEEKCPRGATIEAESGKGIATLVLL